MARSRDKNSWRLPRIICRGIGSNGFPAVTAGWISVAATRLGLPARPRGSMNSDAIKEHSTIKCPERGDRTSGTLWFYMVFFCTTQYIIACYNFLYQVFFFFLSHLVDAWHCPEYVSMTQLLNYVVPKSSTSKRETNTINWLSPRFSIMTSSSMRIWYGNKGAPQ